jgi:antitoxin MazE
METIVRSKLIKIGNSKGIRIPQTILKQAHLFEDVELCVEGERLIIQAARKPRQGWEEHFTRMAALGDDKLLDEPTPTQFDDEEWKWQRVSTFT